MSQAVTLKLEVEGLLVKTTHFQYRGQRFKLRSENQDPIDCVVQPKTKAKENCRLRRNCLSKDVGKTLRWKELG